MELTTRLYLQDGHCFEASATIVAVRGKLLAFDRTCFYPGGGGQPPDEGSVALQSGESLRIASVHADQDGIIWHHSTSALPPGIIGQRVRLALNEEKRCALARYHTVLHVLNTVVLRDYAGWITGAQIAADYSRIDFKLERFSAAICTDLEGKGLMPSSKVTTQCGHTTSQRRNSSSAATYFELWRSNRPFPMARCAWLRSRDSMPRHAAELMHTTRLSWVDFPFFARRIKARTINGFTSVWIGS